MRKKGSGRPRTPGFSIGHEFDNSVVVAMADTMRDDGYVREGYVMRCRCGREFTATKTHLTKHPEAACRSCGSRFGALRRVGRKLSKHPLYKCWYGMMQRCENPKAQAYYNYGARGITVCERWHDFQCFADDMGSRPEGLTLERRENDAGYSPDNCYWATPKAQNNNTRANKRFTVNGVSRTLTEWAAQLGATRAAIRNRIVKYGWSIEAACTTPVGMPGRREGTRLIDGKSEFDGKH